MSGLEKIISQIEYESDDRCRSIIEEANKKAQSIIEEAEKNASEILLENEIKTAKKIESMEQIAQSSSEFAKSKILLTSKLEIIDEMLKKSLDEIKNLPDEEYFEIIKALIIGNSRSGEGALCLSEKDKKRLPKGFIEDINKELDGKKITLGETINIDGGFVLVYEDIDINCSFDAIASSKLDELRDALNTVLFD
ncbi:MAG: hypothetical protein IJR70_06800 [Eubacterium sp.]|nr:hypothetical protein [Eubacterium sp.]